MNLSGGGVAAAAAAATTTTTTETTETTTGIVASASVEESVVVASGVMTYDDERLSVRWKERRARFLGCIENTKLIAERTKRRQESARQERLKKERAEMEKYRRRYLDTAMKQYMEQQAKSRESATTSSSSSALLANSHAHHHHHHLLHAQHHHHPQYIPQAPGCFPGFVQAPRGTATPLFMPNHPSVPPCKPNGRKRPYPNGWTQYANMAVMCDPRNGTMYLPAATASVTSSGKEQPQQMFQNDGLSSMQNFNFQNLIPPFSESYCSATLAATRDTGNAGITTTATAATMEMNVPNKMMIGKEIAQLNGNCIVPVAAAPVPVHPETKRAEQYDQVRLGTAVLPTTSQNSPIAVAMASAPPPAVSLSSLVPPASMMMSSEEISNLSTIPDLAESDMKDLMDQFGQGNLLDDLGGNCLDGVLMTTGRCDQQPSTGTVETMADSLNAQSATNSVLSTMSAPCGTPNSAISPAHLSSSARCSTNSLYDSHSAGVTPLQQTPCDQQQQQQRIPPPMNPIALAMSAASVPPVMEPENASALFTAGSTVGSSSSDTNTVNSSNDMSSLSAVPGNFIPNDSNNTVMYNNTLTVPVPSQQQQQQHPQQYTFNPHFHHHYQQQQQQQQQQHHHHPQQNLYQNGCLHQQMSTINNAPTFSGEHMDSTARLYCNGDQYSRFDQCYSHHHQQPQQLYDNSNSKSSIFPRFPPGVAAAPPVPPAPPQALMRYPMAQQYGVAAYLTMKYPNGTGAGTPYWNEQQQQQQQPEMMGMQQQQAYSQMPPFEARAPVYHSHLSHMGDPAAAAAAAVARNPAYQLNSF